MRTPRIAFAVAAATAVLSASCSSMSITTDWDAEADLSSMSTFASLERDDRAPRGRQQQRPAVSSLVSSRIERAVVTELGAKGYREAGLRVADLVVSQDVLIERRTVRTHVGWAYPRRWYGGVAWGTTHVHHYREGTLVIDVLDRRRRALVWRGIAEGAFSKPNPSQDDVQRVVSKLLAGFPP